MSPIHLAAAARRDLHENDASVPAVIDAPDEPIACERIDELGERRRRQRALLRELAAAEGPVAERPEDPQTLPGEGPRIMLLTDKSAETGKGRKQKTSQRGIGLGRRL